MIVQIDPLLAEAIQRAAGVSYPHECCGLLTGEKSGNNVIITGVHQSENVTSGDPTRGFEVDPKLRFDLMRMVESLGDGTEIIGHYHSHPDHLAEPSATDLSMAYETDFIWLICASSKVGGGNIGAFRPKSDRSDFETLELSIEQII